MYRLLAELPHRERIAAIDYQWNKGLITTDEWVEMTEEAEAQFKDQHLLFAALEAAATANYGRAVIVETERGERDGVIISHHLVGGGDNGWSIQYEIKIKRLGTGWRRNGEFRFQ